MIHTNTAYTFKHKKLTRIEIIHNRDIIHNGISRKGMELIQWKLIGLHPIDMKAESH